MNQTRIPRTAKSKRPQYFADPATDKILNMMINLLGEVAVIRDRLDTVERLLDGHRLVPVAEIEAYRPPPEIEQARDQTRTRLIERVLRPVAKELEETTRSEWQGEHSVS